VPLTCTHVAHAPNDRKSVHGHGCRSASNRHLTCTQVTHAQPCARHAQSAHVTHTPIEGVRACTAACATDCVRP
jgi:hypothetical protein